MNRLLELNVLPIINENDTVSVEEIENIMFVLCKNIINLYLGYYSGKRMPKTEKIKLLILTILFKDE